MNRAARAALLALGAALFALAGHYDFPLCPLAGSFGLPCPGCGLTRASLALLHGDVRGALQLHPLVLVLTPLALAIAGVTAFELLRAPSAARSRPYFVSNRRVVTVASAALLVLTLGVWLARFGGFFGGPVEVTSMRDWVASRKLTH